MSARESDEAPERVYVVDDDAGVLRSLCRLLRSAGYEPAPFGSAGDFLGALPADASGCVVLDLSMPDFDGLALQRELSGRAPLPVVFVSGRGDVPKSVSAMKQGAVDFLTKPVKSAPLLAAIEKALALDRERRRYGRAAEEVRARIESLTPREREVLEGVVAGKLNKQIAGSLGIAEQTVKVHRARVMDKMGVSSLAELVRHMDRAKIRRR
jgi:FixJ family two-component response regulator